MDIQKIKEYAFNCHTNVNQFYDDKPYSYHLEMVYEFAKKFIHLIKENQNLVLASCYVHDVIEDTRQTYNDVKDECGIEIAEIAYALTNEKGKNRKERANEKYYVGIINTPYARFIKICDRLANISYSKSKNSSMLNKYRKESQDFKNYLYIEEYDEMFRELDNLLTQLDTLKL